MQQLTFYFEHISGPATIPRALLTRGQGPTPIGSLHRSDYSVDKTAASRNVMDVLTEICKQLKRLFLLLIYLMI